MPTGFASLETVFEKVIALMPNKFDSNDFILKLAQEYSQLYVQALGEYADSEKPFQVLRNQVAMRLLKFPDHVASIGEHISRDFLQQESTVTLWQKVGK